MKPKELKIGELYQWTTKGYLGCPVVFLGCRYVPGYVMYYKFLEGKRIVEFQWFADETLEFVEL